MPHNSDLGGRHRLPATRETTLTLHLSFVSLAAVLLLRCGLRTLRLRMYISARGSAQVGVVPEAVTALDTLRESFAPAHPICTLSADFSAAAASLSLLDLNHALYRCAAESQEEEGGVYDVPGYGPLLFSGLQGVANLLEEVEATGNLGHPLCRNLRDGNWLLDYCSARLEARPGTAHFGGMLRRYLSLVGRLPRPVVPAYCGIVIGAAHKALMGRCAELMSALVQRSGRLVRGLAMCSAQLYGADPHGERLPLLAAGLPHFAAGWARCWGR